METQNGRKPQNASLILNKYYIHFTNTNWKEASTPQIYQHQLEGGYNPLALPVPTQRRLQPLAHKHWPMKRTSILSELQLTLAPPYHPTTLICYNNSIVQSFCQSK